MVYVLGFSSPEERFEALYYDTRGVSRIFEMTLDGKNWSMLKQDRDFYQRFSAQINGDTIAATMEASEGQGNTWRKDFDLLFTKAK